VAGTELRSGQDRPLSLHKLVYLVDGDDVTIGRRDTDSYAIFPPDGAELVRRLEAGITPHEAARWYEAEYGQSVDIDHVVAAVSELGFLREPDEMPPAITPVRWQRLGKALFSPPAWVAYGAVVTWALVTAVRSPELRPTYHSIFFTQYFSIIELTLFAVAFPLIVLHESFHALAARRLGVRSRLRFGHRFYYVVLETALDGLVAVPRRKRYLPILAGMLADTLVLSAFIIAASLTRGPGGVLSPEGRLCLAFAFATLLRLAWQFLFYLRTDLYVLITTVLGCVDLHTTAKRMLRHRFSRLLGRGRQPADEPDWHPADRRAAQWYSWLIVVGYAVSLAMIILVAAPIAYWMFSGALGRFIGDSRASGLQLLDSAVFLALNFQQVALTAWLTIREQRLRRKAKFRHVIA
jgi:hypothetical protein